MDFNPSQLPEIDAVEVVTLKGIGPGSPTDKNGLKAANAPYVRLTGELAQQTATLWRHLPPGENMRCHILPFGLRFYRDGELLLQASICWQCNNIFGEAQRREVFFSFEAAHETSQSLLALCRQVTKSN